MENKTSRQVFADFYGGENPRPSVIEDQAIGTTRDLEGSSQIMLYDLEQHVRKLLRGFTNIFQGFPNLLSQVAIGAQSLMETIEEQVAASELSLKFGKPLSLLALPMAMKLASRESLAKTDARQSAGKLEEYSQATKQWLSEFSLMLKLQLIALEEEIKQHDLAKTQVASTSQIDPSVGLLKEKFLSKFNMKKGKDEEQRSIMQRAIVWVESRGELLSRGLGAIQPIAIQSTSTSLPA